MHAFKFDYGFICYVINPQQATDIYKRLLLENRDDLALNVYVAMCYYKLDYYDVSLEILAVYLQSHPLSPIGPYHSSDHIGFPVSPSNLSCISTCRH